MISHFSISSEKFFVISGYMETSEIFFLIPSKRISFCSSYFPLLFAVFSFNLSAIHFLALEVLSFDISV